ncbi:MAG: ABC transporter ATP-binding protein [Pseudomonadota bacterium]
MTGSALIEVDGLTVEFTTRDGPVTAVHDVDLMLNKGETLGIVGESGSGKSVTSFAIMRILDRNGRIVHGRLHYGGVDLRTANQTDMNDIRGREISMIFQNPRVALNPIRKIGRQIEDVLRRHAQASRGDARQRAIALLDTVKIAEPAERYHAYPHELSGGMCQRVVIAIALACQPRVLIADEPTTGLDVTTQKAILDLVKELVRARGMSAILITHDLGLAAMYCDRIEVMKAGKVVESATSQALFAAPKHPYTRALVNATPRPGCRVADLLPDGAHERADSRDGIVKAPTKTDRPLLEISNLMKVFDRQRLGLLPFGRRDVTPPPAVGGLSFELMRGESVGLVGESGCGKSTTSLLLMRLLDPTSGSIVFDGTDLASIPASEFAARPERPRLQMVFQDPTESLNPRFTAARSIADPILRLGAFTGRGAVQRRVSELADMVSLSRDLLERFPHQLSGGQKARVGIARAIALHPEFLVLDEPTAALDVSVQAVVLNLLVELRAALNMTYLFVSHDLNVVRLMCDRVMVMQRGRLVEQGDVEDVLSTPASDYTRRLLAASPEPPPRQSDQNHATSGAAF